MTLKPASMASTVHGGGNRLIGHLDFTARDLRSLKVYYMMFELGESDKPEGRVSLFRRDDSGQGSHFSD